MNKIFFLSALRQYLYTAGGFVWCDTGHFMAQEKWAYDFHDDATPLSFQLQVTEDFF